MHSDGDVGSARYEPAAGTTSPMPDHKGFKLHELVNFQKFSTLRVNNKSTPECRPPLAKAPHNSHSIKIPDL